MPVTARRIATVLRRRRPAAAAFDPWNGYLTAVEPALAAVPRVHRFARPPVLGQPTLPPLPLSVWIEGNGEPAERTRAALTAGTQAATVELDGPLRDALTWTRDEWVVLVRAGDEPAPLALERLGQAAALAADADLITCDDDGLAHNRARHAPRFRPGPSPDRWLACDDSGPLLVVRRERAAALVGDLGEGSAWRHRLALALAGVASECHAHVPVLLCHRGADVPDAPMLSPAALASVLRKWDPSARVEQGGALRRVRRPVSREPTVEAIICFRDRPELLARCVVSMLARTNYERLTLALVDNGSQTTETAELLRRLSRHPRVRILRDPQPFNFARLNNRAVATSSADMLVFVNNDTDFIDGGWILPLLEEALRPEVGAVAPLLLYPDGNVQHAGAAIGLHGYAGHPFAGLAPDAETPFGRAAGGTRNWLAVTAACMMVERAKVAAVGGFDESFVVGGNDVDLCLRLTASGARSLCVPDAVVLHDESRSRGAHVDPGDFVASERSYGEFRTVGDPFYNPNLTLQGTDCSVRTAGEGSGE